MKKLLAAITLSICLIAIFIVPAYAMEPPTKTEIKQFKQDGTWAQRLERALKIGNYQSDPYLAWEMQNKAKRLMLKAQGLSEAEIEKQLDKTPPPARIGLPTKGSPKVLALLIDFPDYPHGANQTVADFTTKFTGNGSNNTANYPYESLCNFYKRSSYNQLTIRGNVLGWYRAAHNRSYYESIGDGPGQDVLIKEALNYYNSLGHNFSQYDNNNDGLIEAIYIKWTGPDNGWANFWWAYQWVFHDSAYTIDGKHLGRYIWSWYSRPVGGVYQPRTDIHETGHALGLPDYYDYDPDVGPDGGLGGLDMMDNAWGDHNCFSKFLLDWMTPTIIPSGSQTKTFYPSGTTKSAALIMPGATNSNFNQFFMAQYRKRQTGNDPANYPTSGMLIWHVDSTLSGNNFLYDNSTTDHKLLALEQADGLGEIEASDESMTADAGDYYLPPKTFGPTTNPNSNRYDGTQTNVVINNLTTPGSMMSAKLSIATPPSFSVSGRVTASNSTSPAPEIESAGKLLKTAGKPPGTSVPITIGQTVNGALTNTDQTYLNWGIIDCYRFDAPAGQQVAILLTSSQFDTYLGLLNDSGLNVQDNNGGGGTNSRIPAGSGYYTLTAGGTYYIIVNSYSGTSLGNYTLSLTSSGLPGIAGVTMTFTKLSGAGNVPAAVTTGANGNWSQTGFTPGSAYRVTPSKNGYIFNPNYIDFSAASTTLNFSGSATFSGSGHVTEATGSGPVTGAESPGNVVNTLTGVSNNKPGNKPARIITKPPARATITPISIGQTVNETLTNADYFSGAYYYDLYSFAISSSQQIYIAMSSSQFDTFLELYRVEGDYLVLIDLDNDGGGGTNSRIPAVSDCITLTDGTYIIGASQNIISGFGNYTLTLGTPGIAGVTMTFTKLSGTGNVPAAVTTDANGDWKQTGFTPGSTYRVTPTKNGYIFNPEYIDFSSESTTLNFTGSANFSGSGQVTEAAGSGAAPEAESTGKILKTVNKAAIKSITSDPITIGQTVNGSLTSADQTLEEWGIVDCYQFDAQAGQQVAILLTSSEFDTFLGLQNDSGIVSFNDDGGGGTNSRIPAGSSYYTLTAGGTYYIIVGSFGGASLGDYTLSLIAPVGIAGVTMNFTKLSGTGNIPAAVITDASGKWNQTGFAPGSIYRVTPAKDGYTFNPEYIDFSSASAMLNFTGASIPSITIGERLNGMLSDNDFLYTELAGIHYTDKFSFSAASGQQIAISLTSRDFDSYLYLLGPSGSLIAYDDSSSGEGADSMIPWDGFYTLPSTGTYTIGVTSYNNNGTGRYSLSLCSPTNYVVSGLAKSTGDTWIYRDGEMLDGVTMTFSRISGTGTIPAAVMTDNQGNWFQTGFQSETVYRVTPEKEGYTFKPASLDFTSIKNRLDFTGAASGSTFNASGNVSAAGGVGISGITMVFQRTSGNGSIPPAVVTDENGNWSQKGFQTGAVYRVMPTNTSGYAFTPAYIDFSGESAALNFTGDAPTEKQWTFMIYGAADNNLSYDLNLDMNEIAAAGYNSNINVVILADQENNNDSSYRALEPTGWVVKSNLGEVDTGDPQTLQNFIQWTQTNYPAQKYFLDLWNHGGGFKAENDEIPQPLRGICWDDTNGGNFLSMPKLHTSLANAEVPYNTLAVGMDACLMAQLEVAYEVKDNSAALVASEESIPGSGWPYTPVINYLNTNPTATISQYAAQIPPIYVTHYGSLCMSAVDQANVNSLATAANNLANVLKNNVVSYRTQIDMARANSMQYDFNDFVDLYDFTLKLDAYCAGMPDLSAATSAVRSAITAAVIQNNTAGGYVNSHGLTIWMPALGNNIYSIYKTVYSQLQFAADTQWDEFLEAFMGS